MMAVDLEKSIQLLQEDDWREKDVPDALVLGRGRQGRRFPQH